MRYLLMAAMAATPALTMADHMAMVPMQAKTSEHRSAAVSNDPLQKMAYQAVVLKLWPDVPHWKLEIYRRVLHEGITVKGLAIRTTYCPHCSGTGCADGSHVRDGICAASPNVPMHAIIWLETEGLLKVCDRGGAVRTPSGSENAHFDVWVPHCDGGCWTGPGTKREVPWAIIPSK